jgi:hypothetical protein
LEVRFRAQERKIEPRNINFAHVGAGRLRAFAIRFGKSTAQAFRRRVGMSLEDQDRFRHRLRPFSQLVAKRRRLDQGLKRP